MSRQPWTTELRRPGNGGVLAVACGAHALHDGFTDLIYVLLPLWHAEFGIGYAEIGMFGRFYGRHGRIPGSRRQAGGTLRREVAPCGRDHAGWGRLPHRRREQWVRCAHRRARARRPRLQRPAPDRLESSGEQVFEGKKSRDALASYNFLAMWERSHSRPPRPGSWRSCRGDPQRSFRELSALPWGWPCFSAAAIVSFSQRYPPRRIIIANTPPWHQRHPGVSAAIVDWGHRQCDAYGLPHLPAFLLKAKGADSCRRSAFPSPSSSREVPRASSSAVSLARGSGHSHRFPDRGAHRRRKS